MDEADLQMSEHLGEVYSYPAPDQRTSGEYHGRVTAASSGRVVATGKALALGVKLTLR